MNTKVLLLGVDGGGTSCRARLCAFSGQLLGEAATGPANLRLGLQQSFSEILDAAAQCLSQAGLPRSYLGKIVACLALAGASEPSLSGGRPILSASVPSERSSPPMRTPPVSVRTVTMTAA